MNIIKSDTIALHGAANSMQGGRQENQDDYGFIDTPLGFLLIICDGMGGGPGGKTASHIVKREIATALCQCYATISRERALKMAVAKAEEALENKVKEVPQLSGMGSTFVAILINSHSAMIAHAGDSRCYCLRGKKVRYKSADHSLVAELVRSKALTEEEARVSPQSNIITRGLGNVSNHVPDIDEIPYKKGDRFVLCTDGVWGIMPHKDLLDRLSTDADIGNLVSNISEEIDKVGFAKGGNHDNHTLAIFDIDVDSEMVDTTARNRMIAILGGCAILLAAIVIILLSSDKIREFYNHKNTTEDNTINTGYPGGKGRSRKNTGYAAFPVKVDGVAAVDTLKKDTTEQPVTLSATDSIIMLIGNLRQAFDGAININCDNDTVARKAIDNYKKNIRALTDRLRPLIPEDIEAAKLKFDSIYTDVKSDKLRWVVGQQDDGRYHTTKTCRSWLEKQLERLAKLEKIIKDTKR